MAQHKLFRGASYGEEGEAAVGQGALGRDGEQDQEDGGGEEDGEAEGVHGS